MPSVKRLARKELRDPGITARSAENEVPLQVMVPASVRRQVALVSAQRGDNIRTTILRGLLAIGIDIPKSELVDRRGRKRQERSDGAQ